MTLLTSEQNKNAVEYMEEIMNDDEEASNQESHL